MSGINQQILRWLISVPANDVNFKSNLRLAGADTVRAAIEEIKDKDNNRVKLKALTARLNRCLDELTTIQNRQNRTLTMDVETIRAEREMEKQKEVEQSQRERFIAQAHEVIGRVQSNLLMEKFADVSNLIHLKQIKETKIYRDLPMIGTWEKYCNYIGLSRAQVDEDLRNLAVFGEDFLLTCQQFSLGYRDIRKLRKLTHDGVVKVDDDAITIGDETIPIDPEHADDLHAAIERIIEQNSALSSRVERLEKNKDDIVKEETKGFKAEVSALVKEVKRLKAFDPEEKDRSWSVGQMEAISQHCAAFALTVSKFILDERLKGDHQLVSQINSHIMEAELTLKELRDRFEAEYDIYGS